MEIGRQTQPGSPRHNGTRALEAQTDSKFKASLGCLLQSCQRKKSTQKNAKIRQKEAQSGERWREPEPHHRPWDAAHAGPGWKALEGKQEADGTLCITIREAGTGLTTFFKPTIL